MSLTIMTIVHKMGLVRYIMPDIISKIPLLAGSFNVYFLPNFGHIKASRWISKFTGL